jgi:hypothetical protein
MRSASIRRVVPAELHVSSVRVLRTAFTSLLKARSHDGALGTSMTGSLVSLVDVDAVVPVS